MVVWERLFQAAFVVSFCIQTVMSMDSDRDSHTTATTNAALTLGKCWVIYQGVKIMSCKLCGSKSNDEVPYPVSDAYDPSTDLYQRRRPWLHYKVCPGGRRARGRVCACCWSVFKQSGLYNQYDSLKKNIDYIKSDKVQRHSHFLKMLKKYESRQASQAEIGQCENGGRQTASQRTRLSRDVVIQQQLSSKERDGFKEKVLYDYVEVPVWMEENPRKVPPKVEKAWVIDIQTGLVACL